MQKAGINFVRFEGIHLNSYDIVSSQSSHFVVNRQRTIRFKRKRTSVVDDKWCNYHNVVAACLASGTVQELIRDIALGVPQIDTSVSVSGNRSLIKTYKHLIFMDGGYSSDPRRKARKKAKSDFFQIKTKPDSVRAIFEELLVYKPHKIEMHKDLNSGVMAVGERVCFNYALLFARRKTVDLDLPLVLNHPYGSVDPELMQGVKLFLKKQKCQQILFLSESERERVRARIGSCV